MIAVDTNILLHAHRADSPWHEAAVSSLTRVARQTWALPWPCVHEFLAIATHPRVLKPPTPVSEALLTVRDWFTAPTVRMLREAEGYPAILEEVIRKSGVVGPRVHDARIAALCIQDGIEELWTADRDFSRFGALKTRNPLI